MVIAEYPAANLVCPESVRRELRANETGSTVFLVPQPMTTSGDQPDTALQWRITATSPSVGKRGLVDGMDCGRPNDAVELQLGRYTFAYSSSSGGGGGGRKPACQFTVEVLGNE